MATNNDQPNIPGAPDEHPASVPVPSDKDMPYAFNALGKPSLADPNFKMPGHKQADPTAISAAAAARYQASVAAAKAKSDAQLRADTGQSQPQHPTPNATFKPAPRKGK